MGKLPSGPRFAVGEHLIALRGGRFEPAEVIGSTGRAPYPDSLRLRFTDGAVLEHELRSIYRPGPAFDAYLAARTRHDEAVALDGWDSPVARRARLPMHKAENAAFCAHPAGAFWRAHHNW